MTVSKNPDEVVNTCRRCQCELTVAQGGNVFTVCEACWNAPDASPHDGARATREDAPERAERTLGVRRRMDDERSSVTRTFRLRRDGGQSEVALYFHVGMYTDGQPGEVFIRVEDPASTKLAGLMDALAVMMSIALQHNVPLAQLTSKMRGTQFEPRGFTGDPEIPNCSSPLDLLARWLERKFGVVDSQT